MSSLLTSCCGNEKQSTAAPGASSGRIRSVILLVVSVALQLTFQFGIAPFVVRNAPGWKAIIVGNIWLDGCTTGNNETDDDNDESLLESCVGRAANYRVAAVTTLFYVVSAAVAFVKPTANREAWPAKIILYLLAIVGSVFLPSEPTLTPIYLVIAIVGGALFIGFQQLVILDVAHNWNDSWVEKSNKAEAEEIGSGKKWLMAILASCALLFGGSLAVLVYLFVQYSGCPTNNAVIALTLLFSILVTTAQMTGDEGSLLSSASICAWAVFLCYNAVSKNPNSACNPNLGELSPFRMVLGLSVTLLSLAWTGWSYTAADKWSDTAANNSNKPDDPPDVEGLTDDATKRVTGIVVSGSSNDTDGTTYGATTTKDTDDEPKEAIASGNSMDTTSKHTWKLNVALAAVSCWSAMTLTEWGQIQTSGSVANPTVGRISMWVIIGGQWFILSLYIWTLVAPRLFPSRDFS